MTQTVIGTFDDLKNAHRAVDDLIQSGFSQGDISLISNREGGAPGAAGDVPNIGPLEETGGSGRDAAPGAAIGGLAGFIAGIAALAIPGIGPIIAAGPLATAIMGATVGAAAGGLITGFTNVGMSKEEAEMYSEHVRRGGSVVAVNTNDTRAQQAADILNQDGAFDVDERAESWRSEGWSGPAIAEPRGRRLSYTNDLKADPGHITPVPSDQVGRTRGDEGGAKVFVW